MTVRIEHGLLGDREIPAEVYWGIHTLRAIESSKISTQKVSDVPQFVRSMVMAKETTAQANGALGAIKPEIAAAIEKAYDEVLVKDRCLDQFSFDVYQDGAGTSVNMNTNEVITSLALEVSGYKKGRYGIANPIDHVDASQSTNDAYPTSFRLAVYYSIGELLERLAILRNAFAAKAEELKDVLKISHAQLQDAVPITAGQEFQSSQVLLEEEILNLDHTRSLLLEVNLGATAISTGVNTSKGYAALVVEKLSKVGGLPCKLTENLIGATSDCGAYVMIHGVLKRTAVKLSKICNDLRLLSSGPCTGLKKINLPELQAGSSIMSAEVDPVIPEVVNQVCFKVIGNDTTITFAAETGQLQLNVMEPVIAQCMFETISLLGNAAVNLSEKCVKGITVNREICERCVFSSIDLVTYLNPYIGHHSGDLVGKTCVQTGESVREVVLERGLLSKEEPNRILSPENPMNPYL